MSLVELRSVAQATGVKVAWSDGRADLISRINARLSDLAKPLAVDAPPDYAPPDDQQQAAQRNIVAALKPLTDRGMRLTFPAPDTWQIDHLKHQDSGNINQPVRVIYDIAREVMRCATGR